MHKLGPFLHLHVRLHCFMVYGILYLELRKMQAYNIPWKGSLMHYKMGIDRLLYHAKVLLCLIMTKMGYTGCFVKPVAILHAILWPMHRLLVCLTLLITMLRCLLSTI